LRPTRPELPRQQRPTIINNTTIINNIPGAYTLRVHRYGPWHRQHGYVAYHDRPFSITHTYHRDHIYRDFCNRTCHRTIWPRYRFLLHYSFGPYSAFRYCYPYYHRKYVFVSLGGFWPIGYRYIRYYWYGWHPYTWYGYYPVPREVRHETYNYYTYNYYYSGEATAPTSYETAAIPAKITPVDHTTFADVRAKLAAQAAKEPEQPTAADTCFEQAVQAFEKARYQQAAEKFARAIELAPDDIILPFAYAQALFANEQYTQAAAVLRTALAKIKPDQQTAFYPRGLYSDDDTLLDHIDRLAEKAEFYSFDADLQLLLGYHLLGIGELDAARDPLLKAAQDVNNAESAGILLDLLEKLRAGAQAQGHQPNQSSDEPGDKEDD